MNFWADTPYLTAYVRNEFLHDHEKGKGDFTPCTVFGFRSEVMRAPMFQIMLESGAQWARIPIHALCSKPCPEMALQLTVWWDSFSRNCQVKEVALMTVFWCDGGWSEVPDQSKDHHIIALDTGQFIAYPNNRLLWADPSWIRGEVPRDWRSPSDNYSVEALP